MTVRTLTLANSVDSAENVRLTNSGRVLSSSALDSRSGIYPSGSNPFDLVSASAMVANITPGRAYIDGTANATQGGYDFISDANYPITFANGEAAVNRVDRVCGTVYHNFYDASGLTIADIVYVKGQSSGLSNAIPATSTLFWEVTVPAGASAGGGGINFSTARSDKRSYTAAAGGLLVIPSATIRAAIANPYNGMSIWRSDQKWEEVHDGTAWRVQGIVAVANVAGLALITNPLTNQMALTADTKSLWIWSGSAWGLMLGNTGNLQWATTSITTVTNSITTKAVTWPALSGSSFGCLVTGNTGSPGPAGVDYVSYSGISSTGATLNIYRLGAVTTTISYAAFGF